MPHSACGNYYLLESCYEFIAKVLYQVGRLLSSIWLKRSLVSGLVCLVFSSASPAQYRYDVWTTDQGLPQNTVSAICQTRDGYLWFTTLDGLVRYDGVRFTVFDSENSEGINSTRFNTLCEDAEGNLWAGTQDGGLTRYRDGVFTSYTTGDGLPENFIRGLFRDGENGLLVVTDGGKMVHWRNGQFIPYAPPGLDFSSFTYLGRSGALWDLTRAGLRRYRDGQVSTYSAPDDFSGYGHYFRARFESGDGSFWIGLRNSTLHHWQQGRVTAYPAGSQPDALAGAFCEDRQGNFWVGTTRGELRQLRDGRFITVATLPGADITSIYEDREGNIWVGTYLQGIYRLRPKVVTVYTESDGLASNNIYPIFEDRKGNVWIGGYGLTRYRDGVFQSYTNIDTVLRDQVTSIHEDREGRLWLGGNGKVGWFEDGKYTSFSARLGHSTGHVYAIYQDSRGRLWFGTNSGLIEYSDGRAVTYRTGDGLAGDDVKEIYEDRQGRLWIASYGGLSVFQDGRFTSYTEKDGLASNRVRTIYEDRDGIIWIGTYDGGLSRFEDGRFTTYTTRDGLFNNGVFRILEDGRGNFWMSSNRGIYRVSRQQLNDYAEGKTRVITCVAYGKPDGLDNTECNGGRQPAGVRTRDGKLWFPTQGGVAVIDPEAVPFNSLPPPVVIEGCVLNKEPVAHQPLLRIEPG
ncbi:MAG TPA: two-component regulator propeller domain-containing protein, partial [Blastocatellia bacterium]|nr:two-component regulator propeller domain-containing protein [Blastocatellia bacterium]